MQFGAKPLFENVSVKFGEGNRYGLIGANGSGKSTFMKILGGDLEQSSGEVAIDNGVRLGKLRQDQFAYEDMRVLDVVMMGHTEMWAAMTERDAIYANMEATDDGYDEALLLDSSGFVSEGAGENLFLVKDGVVYTPDLSAGALNGITRNTVLHICKDLGLEVVQKRITRDECYIADEMFFTGTAAEVTPIRELDRIPIGQGARGPITANIQSAFFDIVNGRNPKYAHWLTLV
jgi:branched-chain amino acid aminotransferase group I